MAKTKALVTRTAIASQSDDLLHKIAADIGKEVAAYVQMQYPEAVRAASSTFLLSLRNSIHNEIVSAVRDEHWVGDLENGILRKAASPDEWLQWRRMWRRRLLALWKRNQE